MKDSWRPTATVHNLLRRATLLKTVRTFFEQRNVVEVQTPVLDRYGVTDPNLENIEVAQYGWLQTSPEYHMKRLLAAGMPCCYQITSAFRAGERGRWHNTEFAMLEWYRLGYTLDELMAEVADLVDELLGAEERHVVTVRELLDRAYGVNPHQVNEEDARQTAIAHGLEKPFSWLDAIDFLLDKAIREYGRERFFVVDYPAYMSALAKCEERDGERVANRFELIVNGLEIANGYDELLDAGELDCRADQDNRIREEKGLTRVALDPGLRSAMQHGLPPCCGVAVGLDRLFALSLEGSNLDAVIAFPSDLSESR